MSPSSLKEVVSQFLDKTGLEAIFRFAPELRVLNVAGTDHLASILLDTQSIAFNDVALFNLFSYLSNHRGALFKAAEWPDFELLLEKAEVRYASGNVSAGLTTYTPPGHYKVSAVVGLCYSEQEHEEYIPIVSLAIGNADGPLKNALNDVLSSRLYRQRTRHSVRTEFLQNILVIWVQMINSWVLGKNQSKGPPAFAKEEVVSPELDAPPKPSPSSEVQPSAISKRKREPSHDENSGNDSKRRAHETTPSTVRRTASPSRSTNDPYRNLSAWPRTIQTLCQRDRPDRLPSLPRGIDLGAMFGRTAFNKRAGIATNRFWSVWSESTRSKMFGPGVGHDNLAALPSLLQPFSPASPGAPGFIIDVMGTNEYNRDYSSRSNKNIYTVIVGNEQDDFLYCGEYRFSGTDYTIEWEDLPQSCRTAWVNRIYKLRNTVFAFSLGRAVGPDPSRDSIFQAFEDGFLQPRGFTAHCLAYHEEIQLEIVRSNGGNRQTQRL